MPSFMLALSGSGSSPTAGESSADAVAKQKHKAYSMEVAKALWTFAELGQAETLRFKIDEIKSLHFQWARTGSPMASSITETRACTARRCLLRRQKGRPC